MMDKLNPNDRSVLLFCTPGHPSISKVGGCVKINCYYACRSGDKAAKGICMYEELLKLLYRISPQ